MEAYVSAFYDLVKNTSEVYGYELSADIEAYLVYFLADYTRKKGFPPEKAFAITLAEIKQSGETVHRAKWLAEDCLFLTSFCPTYAKRQGMSLRYYTKIGAISYYDYSDAIRDDFFKRLGDAFEFLRDFIEETLNSRPKQIQEIIWLAENGSYTARRQLPENMIFLSNSYRYS
jgi:hypothetical protein